MPEERAKRRWEDKWKQCLLFPCASWLALCKHNLATHPHAKSLGRCTGLPSCGSLTTTHTRYLCNSLRSWAWRVVRVLTGWIQGSWSKDGDLSINNQSSWCHSWEVSRRVSGQRKQSKILFSFPSLSTTFSTFPEVWQLKGLRWCAWPALPGGPVSEQFFLWEWKAGCRAVRLQCGNPCSQTQGEGRVCN